MLVFYIGQGTLMMIVFFFLKQIYAHGALTMFFLQKTWPWTLTMLVFGWKQGHWWCLFPFTTYEQGHVRCFLKIWTGICDCWNSTTFLNIILWTWTLKMLVFKNEQGHGRCLFFRNEQGHRKYEKAYVGVCGCVYVCMCVCVSVCV